MVALEANGFHSTDAPGGAFFYCKVNMERQGLFRGREGGAVGRRARGGEGEGDFEAIGCNKQWWKQQGRVRLIPRQNQGHLHKHSQSAPLTTSSVLCRELPTC